MHFVEKLENTDKTEEIKNVLFTTVDTKCIYPFSVFSLCVGVCTLAKSKLVVHNAL